MQTVHDYLRARLLNQAGIFEPAEPAPGLGEIARVQSRPSFEEYRRNRLIMGYFATAVSSLKSAAKSTIT